MVLMVVVQSYQKWWQQQLLALMNDLSMSHVGHTMPSTLKTVPLKIFKQ